MYLSLTCGVYNPCDKPKLYQTVDALSNTSVPNYFKHYPSLQCFNDPFLKIFLYIPHVQFLLLGIDLKGMHGILSKIYITNMIENTYMCS